MTRTMNSQALVLLDRILGLSGSSAGEQYTTLDDGNVQQVIEISAIARRSLTPAGTAGAFSAVMINKIGVAGVQRTTLDPYNFENTLGAAPSYPTNSYPVPVPRGFDVWLIGATCQTDERTMVDYCQVELIYENANNAVRIEYDKASGVANQEGNDDMYVTLGRWDTFPDEDTSWAPGTMYEGFTENGTSYLHINQRIPKKALIGFVSGTSANDNKCYLNIILGLFPEALGQDVAT